MFHSIINPPVTVVYVSFVHGFEVNLFSVRNVQRNDTTVLNKTESYVLGGRLISPLKDNGLYLRVIRVAQGQLVNQTSALIAKFAEKFIFPNKGSCFH